MAVSVTRGFAFTASLGLGMKVSAWRDIIGQVLRVRLAKKDPYKVEVAPDDPYKVEKATPEGE
jgi:hypothetical protein